MTELPRRSSPWRSLNAWESVSEAGGPPVALPLQTKDTSAKVDACSGPMRNGGVGGQKRASHGVTFISSESRVRQLTTKLADTSRKKAEQGQHQALGRVASIL